MAPNETQRRLKQRGGGLNAWQGAEAKNKPQCVGVKRSELNILFGKKLKQTLCHCFSLFPSVFA
jgi:hypothetical protein